MHYRFTIYGISCNSCIKKITELFEDKAKTENLKFNKDNSQIEFDTNLEMNSNILNNLLATIGDYTVDYVGEKHQTNDDITKPSYRPIFLIFTYLLIVNISLLIAGGSIKGFMTNFMASFFLVFSFFKLLDLKGFAASYSSYDIIAQKLSYYGYVYPFLELGFGVGYILSGNSIYLNIVVFIVMLLSSIGVIKAKLTKQTFSCACVGTFLKVPLGSIAIIEDTMMVIMSLFMIINIIKA